MSRQDDPFEARKAARRDLGSFLRQEIPGLEKRVSNYDNLGELPIRGDGARDYIGIVVGMRGQLTRAAARNAAKAWRKATERCPKAVFNISFAGYDDDPRELNEFPDVCSYAKHWARFAGLDDPEAANRWLGDGKGRLVSPLPPEMAPGNGAATLTALGVFGPEMQARALRDFKPTTPS